MWVYGLDWAVAVGGDEFQMSVCCCESYNDIPTKQTFVQHTNFYCAYCI